MNPPACPFAPARGCRRGRSVPRGHRPPAERRAASAPYHGGPLARREEIRVVARRLPSAVKAEQRGSAAGGEEGSAGLGASHGSTAARPWSRTPVPLPSRAMAPSVVSRTPVPLPSSTHNAPSRRQRPPHRRKLHPPQNPHRRELHPPQNLRRRELHPPEEDGELHPPDDGELLPLDLPAATCVPGCQIWTAADTRLPARPARHRAPRLPVCPAVRSGRWSWEGGVAGAGGGGAGDLRRTAPPSSSCGRGRTEKRETG
jgi:hypothetical protein